MRLPRFRIRTLMLAVAVTAIVLGLWVLKIRRDERLGRMAYYSRWVRKYRIRQGELAGKPMYQAEQQQLDHFTAMERAWERAARYPWLPVPPDPPEPE